MKIVGKAHKKGAGLLAHELYYELFKPRIKDSKILELRRMPSTTGVHYVGIRHTILGHLHVALDYGCGSLVIRC